MSRDSFPNGENSLATQESLRKKQFVLTYTRLNMAELLESLESGLYRTQGISRALRAQADRLDEYMGMQRNATIQPPFQNTIADLTATVPSNRTAFAPANGMDTMSATSQFQLPPDMIISWPWHNDSLQQELGIFPFVFE